MDRYGDALSLGVKSMDDEHHRLAVLFDEFAACVRENHDPGRTLEVVQAALAQANEHFENEEKLMAANHYPGIDEEKRNHRNLRMQLTTLVGDTLSVPGDNPATQENLATMQRLLFEHITGPDREVASYLIARGVN